MGYQIQDSGQRQEFQTGSVRDTAEGKGRFDLISPVFEERLAKHLEAGAKKYGDRNWELGQPLGRYLDSCKRHINKYQQGKRDEDHLTAAAWNLMAFLHTEQKIRDGELSPDLDKENYLQEPRTPPPLPVLRGYGSTCDGCTMELGEYESRRTGFCCLCRADWGMK